MSKKELGRVGVLARVKSEELGVVDAAQLLRVSYRQAKRLWKRFREEGAAGLQHGSAGRPSNRAHDKKFRKKVRRLVRAKYGGAVGERVGPPRAAERDRIFRLESERTGSEDWVVRYDNRFFQRQPQSRYYAPAQSKVLVCEGRHGRIAIEYRGRTVRWREIVAPAKPQVLDTATGNARPHVPIAVKKRKWAPPANHPWHQAVRREVQKRCPKWAATTSRPLLAKSSAAP